MRELIDRLAQEHTLGRQEFIDLLENRDAALDEYLFQRAAAVRQEVFGKQVYLRGLIEFTNYCKNDCYYCGIRRSNREAQRYRLGEEEILACCREGYGLGFRTFVLQGGEDPYFTTARMCGLVGAI
ncbi:MAG: [FeFe] hydrogenase H-cluster radical SAM maturase HydE, partial [Oscillospiraceae bacterium]|nr:[FeFe] hydrogenase H-cluster radical SAM maturase HydE [Oscillospiraceae bacterium]